MCKHNRDDGCQVNTRDQGTQTDESFHEEVVIPRSPEEEHSQNEITKEIPSPSEDPSYVPSIHDELSDDSNNSESEEDSKTVNRPKDDVKFIMFNIQLGKLLKRCSECEAGTRKKYTSTQGSVSRYTEVHQ